MWFDPFGFAGRRERYACYPPISEGLDVRRVGYSHADYAAAGGVLWKGCRGTGFLRQRNHVRLANERGLLSAGFAHAMIATELTCLRLPT